ncbi:MAG: serine/threonine-protein phosphatase [Anaerolineae bacterium]|nr:MAG: serine/threonine-protein phosphatase [Anaerolineae bacterium]
MIRKLFNRFFARKQATEKAPRPQTQEITKPLSAEGVAALLPGQMDKPIEVRPPQLLAASAQSTGRQRDHNEDALFALTALLASNGEHAPFGIYIVADGMGGHQYGEIASETAVRVMSDYLIEHLYRPLFRIEQQPPDMSLRDILENGVQTAHEAILVNAPGGGTTITTAVILNNQLAIAHVGDSRVYHISLTGAMRPLTRDHSLVKRLEELGQLTPEEAATHPQRNVLYRALGQGEPFDPEIIISPIPSPGYLLICSDGLWGVIPENTILQIINTSPTLHAACQRMVDAANEAGGPDNITAILVRLPE